MSSTFHYKVLLSSSSFSIAKDYGWTLSSLATRAVLSPVATTVKPASPLQPSPLTPARYTSLVSTQDMAAWKDWIQLLVWIIGIAGVLGGLYKAAYEIRENRKQRLAELKWKRANAAKELVDDIHKDERALHAVHMLDWCTDKEGQEYEIAPGHKVTITYDQVLQALGKNKGEPKDQKDAFIRDSFDWFFFRVDRIEHYIRRDLTEFEDVQAVFTVYAEQIGKHKPIYEDFLDFHKYSLAKCFFARCPEYKNPPKS
jgi:hypothetical protein